MSDSITHRICAIIFMALFFGCIVSGDTQSAGLFAIASAIFKVGAK